MNEIEEWFMETYGGFGFLISPMVYNPFDFTPSRHVIHPNGYKTPIRIMSELANDLSGGFVPLPDPLAEFKEVISNEMVRLYADDLIPKQIEPHMRLKKFRLKQ